METSEQGRVHGYEIGADTAHPPSLRPGYILEATPPRPWVSTPSPVPVSIVPPTRSRSIMYKARIHDFLIYASLIISVVALVMANRSSGAGNMVAKAKGVAKKVKDLVQVPQPVDLRDQQVNQPEAIIHLKFPPYPPPPQHVQHDRSTHSPAQAYEVTYDDLYRLLNPSSRLSASELVALHHLVRDHTELVSHEETAASILLHRLLCDVNLDHGLERDAPHHNEPDHHHGRLHSILDLVRGDKKGGRTRLERERKLAEREKAVGEREKEVVDALNRLAKEREKE